MEKFKNITTLEDLSHYINSIDDWDSDIKRLCNERGWRYCDKVSRPDLIATDEEGRQLVFGNVSGGDTYIVYPDGYGEKDKHKFTIACTFEGTRYYHVYAKDEDEAREKAKAHFRDNYEDTFNCFDVEELHSTVIN